MGVRTANLEDVGAMSRVHSRAWKGAYVDFISANYLEGISEDGWIPLLNRALKKNIHEAAVFELDGSITGTITFGQGAAENPLAAGTFTQTGNAGEIISLYVLPEYWACKQGYELMKFAVERLKQQGYSNCYLWVIQKNERAVRFYRRFGFKGTGELLTVMLAGLPVTEEKYVFTFV